MKNVFPSYRLEIKYRSDIPAARGKNVPGRAGGRTLRVVMDLSEWKTLSSTIASPFSVGQTGNVIVPTHQTHPCVEALKKMV